MSDRPLEGSGEAGAVGKPAGSGFATSPGEPERAPAPPDPRDAEPANATQWDRAQRLLDGPVSRVMWAYREHFGDRATAQSPEEVTRGELAELILSRSGKGG